MRKKLFCSAQKSHPTFQPKAADTRAEGRGYSLSTSPKSTGTDLIRNKLANPAALRSRTTERVASILERDLDATIQDWTALVEHDEELNRIPLGFQDRSEHLPKLPNDLISRLLLPSLGKAPISIDAREHGTLRSEQGSTVAIVVRESRILQ